MNRYFHTLKRLKWEQVLYRLKYRFQRWTKPKSHVSGKIKPPPPGTFQALQAYQDSLECAFDASKLKQGWFEFIQITESTSFPPRWDFPSKYKLWRYQLHYFDWIWALDFEAARCCVQDWIQHYHYKSTRDGWEAYPTSLRLINWSMFFFVKHADQVHQMPSFQSELLTSIQVQTNWLETRLEYHLMANHLFENAAALTLLGCLLDGDDPERWQTGGLKLLLREIREQVLPDGGHYERSPMYHLRILHILKYIELAHEGIPVPMIVTQSVSSTNDAFGLMCHPDHNIALFNDAAFGVYPLPLVDESLNEQCNGGWQLKHSGYYGYKNCQGDYVIVDAGELGPGYNPGHAHADIFSYELSYGHERLIVDSGNFDYEPGSMRSYCRSTKAHNTVEIDDQDQCHLWGTFRVAESASPQDVKFQKSDNGFELIAWHDGYQRFKARAIHQRNIQFTESNGLVVKDRISGRLPVKAVSRIHFHPDCKIKWLTDNSIEISKGAVACQIHWKTKARASLVDSYYCPRFNESFRNQCLALENSGKAINIDYTIGPRMKR